MWLVSRDGVLRSVEGPPLPDTGQAERVAGRPGAGDGAETPRPRITLGKTIVVLADTNLRPWARARTARLVAAHLGYDLILFAPPPYTNTILFLAFVPSVPAFAVLQVRAEPKVTAPAARRDSPPSANAPHEKAGR
ncbi:hypothetical protein GCM10009863_39670 [Streptomyces axinellae]|uniref:Uncharacterized protein n=1 Tax=Streptomyces axinellae TaxID=552788 RepID=A0ABN3QB57_9ACTN